MVRAVVRIRRRRLRRFSALGPKIHKTGFTLMVRQLAPTPQGLPLEIYAFTNDTNWTNYEGIQGDIFDHLLSIAPEFGIEVFQTPSGEDMRAIGEGLRRAGGQKPGARGPVISDQ